MPNKIKKVPAPISVLLTSEQLNLIQQVLRFLDSTETVYTIAGYAGTGKSFTVKHLIQDIDTKYKNSKKIIALTPTHKAKAVLETFVQGTNVQVMTLHKGLAIKPTIASASKRRGSELVSMDFKLDLNKTVFSPAAGADILIIDEASMISTEIWTAIQELVLMINDDRRISREKGKAVSPMHIIAVGDPGQLPPVGELKSPVFTNVNYFLEHIVRQALDNPVLDLATRIRNSPNGKILSHMSITDKIHQKIVDGRLQTYGYKIYNDEEEFNSALMNCYSVNPLEDIKVLAWTNSTVKRYNKFIRNAFVSNVDAVSQKEILVTQDFNYHYDLENSKEFHVVATTLMTASQWFKMNYYMGTLLKGLDPSFQIFRTEIRNDNKSTIVPIVVPTAQNYQLLAHYLKRIYENPANPKAKEQFYSLRKRFIIMEDVKNANGQVLFKKDIDYAYAMTIHKSQGSTYKKVYIYGRDMDDAELEKELLYVAITRSAEEVHILI